MYPRVLTPFLTNLKPTEPTPINLKQHRQIQRLVDARTAYKVVQPEADEPTLIFTHSEFFARYDLDGVELTQLLEFSRLPGYGMQYTSTGITKILRLDYGLECASF
jgi:hypothetical protein